MKPRTVRASRSLLIITAYFPPWGGGGVIRMTKLVKYLARLGWTITVICSDELQPEVVDETLLREIPESVEVLRVRGPFRFVGGRARGAAATSSRRKLLGPLVSAAKLLLRAFLIPDRWLGWAWRVSRLSDEKLGDPALVLSSGPPHSAHLAASAVAKRMGLPHVVDLRDDWGRNPLHQNPAPWHGPIDRMLEYRTLRHAAAIVTIFETSTAALASRYPSLAARIVSIPNGFDPEDLLGLESRARGSSDGIVRFMYAGSLRGSQDVGSFFDVFGELARSAQGTLHLTLLGFISERHEALARSAIPRDSLAVLPAVSHRAALEAMAEADVLVVFTGGGGAAGADTMTGKIYEYLAVRRPILVVGPAGPASDLVVRSRAGVTAAPSDVAALNDAVREAVHMSSHEVSFSSEIDLRSFDRRNLATRWVEVFEGSLPAGA